MRYRMNYRWIKRYTTLRCLFNLEFNASWYKTYEALSCVHLSKDTAFKSVGIKIQIWNKVEFEIIQRSFRFSIWQSINEEQTQLRHNFSQDISGQLYRFFHLSTVRSELSTFLQFTAVCCKKRPWNVATTAANAGNRNYWREMTGLLAN